MISAHARDPGPAPPRRRSDAGVVRFTARDINGLVLAGDMYGAPYDLLETALGVKAARLRGITCRWRTAGVAQTGRIGPGPAWCWLTPAGMRAAGLRFPARRPPLARLAHMIEQVIANFKTWRIMHTDYRRPLDTFDTTISAVVGLHFYRMA